MTSLSFPKVSIEASFISVPLPLAGCDISVSIGQCPPHPTRLGTAAVCVCRGLQIHSCIHIASVSYMYTYIPNKFNRVPSAHIESASVFLQSST